MVSENSTGLLAAALAIAQGQMHNAVINKVNPHFKSRYADLAAVLDAVRKPLADNKLSITQTEDFIPVGSQQVYVLITTLLHESGQTQKSYRPLPTGVKVQDLHSAITYARRMGISSMCGIASEEDDDGNAASKLERDMVRANVKFVTPEQVTILGNAAVEAGVTSIESFCDYLDILDLNALPASRFNEAMKALEKKKAKANG